jgi:hypothetical protein
MSATVIKDVTRTLQALLLTQLNPGGTSTAQVSLVPPGEALPTGLGVNLYLYRVVESPSTKNGTWAADRTPSSKIPALGLELSYLLTPFATVPDATTASGDDAHTMLGTAMLVFHENPILNQIHMPGFDADTVLPTDLLNSVELLKIRLAAASLEELSKIWATINQPYRLSVAYDVSLVMVPPSAPAPAVGGSVVSTSLSLAPWTAPALESLTPQSGPLGSAGAAGVAVPNQLAIAGSGLASAGLFPTAEFGGQPSTVAAAPAATNTSITISMPLAVDAGPQVDVAVTLHGKTSTSLPFVITPWLAAISPVRTALDSGAGASSLLLTLTGEGLTPSPQAVRFEGASATSAVTSLTPSPDATQVSVNIPTALANGSYQVRVVLGDAAGSVSNSRVLTVIPLLQSPIGLAVVSVNGSQVHQLTVNGARLNGNDVRVRVDGAVYAVGANTNTAQVVLTLGRLLSSGSHNLAVSVDGSVSHFVGLQVP